VIMKLQDCRIAGLQEGRVQFPFRNSFLQSCNAAILQLSDA